MAILRRLRLLARFARETGGVMAVEFSLIAPVMIFMLFGMIELTDAVLAKRRVGMATSMLGDLTTNRADDWIHRSEVANVFAISSRVLEPYGIDEVTVLLTAVTWDDTKDAPVVVWSKRRKPNGQVEDNPDYAVGDVVPGLSDNDFQLADEALVADGQHLILAEMKYPFTSSLSNMYFDNVQIEVQELRVPRKKATLRHCNNTKCTDNTLWNPTKCMPLDESGPTVASRCD